MPLRSIPHVKTTVFQILDNPRCSIPPWIFMPCVTYTLPRSFASCDCRLSEYPQ